MAQNAKTINVKPLGEVKAHFSAYVRDAEIGKDTVITVNGRDIALLTTAKAVSTPVPTPPSGYAPSDWVLLTTRTETLPNKERYVALTALVGQLHGHQSNHQRRDNCAVWMNLVTNALIVAYPTGLWSATNAQYVFAYGTVGTEPDVLGGTTTDRGLAYLLEAWGDEQDSWDNDVAKHAECHQAAIAYGNARLGIV